MQKTLLDGDVYGFTIAEIAAVTVFREQCRAYGLFYCLGCGFKGVLTPNNGMGRETFGVWKKIFHLEYRLFRGERIDGGER